MDGIKEVKEAEITINGEVIEIMGNEREEAWVFAKHLDEEETQRLISKLRDKMPKIDRKLELYGYFFNDDIENYRYEPEIIVYLLNNMFRKNIDLGKKYGTGDRAIYYDPSFVKHDGRYIKNMVEDLYMKHYGED
ncbi:hypothetical protein [Anaeromicropila herbilytica]|uniref:Uncharacterized protein n=1 Tax=Anaeromicropila herbilytica TaxID=2785025 RepID=A0A7R7EK67_9FIRM|nr:hypothetical protein [Anaeromicropila herbilytica]BCN30268.1 hypothetical protein bsdtb5_15630 [Anaeromicropila herbilytica]